MNWILRKIVQAKLTISNEVQLVVTNEVQE